MRLWLPEPHRGSPLNLHRTEWEIGLRVPGVERVTFRRGFADSVTATADAFVRAGEMHVPRDKLATVPENGPAYDGSRFYNAARVGGLGVPLAAGPDDDVNGMGLFAFGSWHAGVCHFAFADGRVAALRATISADTLARLCNRADGQPIPEY